MDKRPYIDLTLHEIYLIRKWADTVPEITEVRLFGSRAKGKATRTSDIDLAVTVEMLDPKHGTAFGELTIQRRGWMAALNATIMPQVNIDIYDREADPTVYQSCQEASILIYP